MTDTTDIKALREGLQSAISQHEMMMGCVMGLSRVDPMYQQCLDALNDLEAERQRADVEHKYASERDTENESLMLTVGRLREEIAALKAKLANPVVMPKYAGDLNHEMAFLRGVEATARKITAAGFTVKGE